MSSTEPELVKDYECPKCGRKESRGLKTPNSTFPNVIWCCCGHIQVYVDSGMSVSVGRGK